MIKQAKFIYCPLGKVFEKQTKTLIRSKKKNQKLKSIKGLFLKEMRNAEIENEIVEIKNMGK